MFQGYHSWTIWINYYKVYLYQFSWFEAWKKPCSISLLGWKLLGKKLQLPLPLIQKVSPLQHTKSHECICLCVFRLLAYTHKAAPIFRILYAVALKKTNGRCLQSLGIIELFSLKVLNCGHVYSKGPMHMSALVVLLEPTCDFRAKPELLYGWV